MKNATPKILIRVWAGGLLALLAVTWRLWTPLREAPRVPPLAWLNGMPPQVDFLLLMGAAAGLLSALHKPRQAAVAFAAGCLAGQMLMDQLRWQPWAYQALLFAVALAALPRATGQRWLRWLLVSVYLYSALAKLDATFVATLGKQILDAALGWFGAAGDTLPDALRSVLAWMMPLSEAAVGLLLLGARTRRAGVIGAVTLHAALIAALGPLGLGHAWGVLLWNAQSALYAWLLFWPAEESETDDSVREGRVWGAGGRGVLLLAMILPLTHAWGWWDRWPSWGLYAPRDERATVLVHPRVADRLPESVPLGDEVDGWWPVELGDWLLEETGAPRYPQNRVAVALALALDREARLGNYLRVQLRGPAGRFSGERRATNIEGAEALREYAAEQYRLNTRAAE